MYQIVTDSCCDVPYQLLKEKDVAFIPMIVNINGQEFLDDLGETFDYEQFLQSLKDKQQPTTSQINVGRYIEFFKPYCEKNEPVVYLCFTSGMSGSYNSALQAVDILKEDYPNADIQVVDTLAASMGEGFIVLEAAKRKLAGASKEEVVQWVNDHKLNLQSWVTVDDLSHLYRGGRLSRTEAAMGGLLNIKPIIHVDAKGTLQNVGKVRGRNKALLKVVEETVNHLVSTESQTVYVAYSGDLEAAEKVMGMLKEKIEITDSGIFPLGPTIASHTGLGCIAIFTFGQERVD
ncbi:DegV family protein [Enterococcus asini]|uniref:DegV family protein n=1 Tax=Enterococcus asini TaxID=57732 RepID=UPI002890425E|nr:DegV family protein [Enterococcus asini]MDT2757960.1 DegV family protein [Enterococcus asini]